MKYIIAPIALAVALALAGAAQAGPFDNHGSYLAPGGLYTPYGH